MTKEDQKEIRGFSCCHLDNEWMLRQLRYGKNTFGARE